MRISDWSSDVCSSDLGADCLARGLADAEETLQHLLADQQVGDLAVELAVEPRDQPADLGPLRRVALQQRRFRADLLEVFGDRGGDGDGGADRKSTRLNSSH